MWQLKKSDAVDFEESQEIRMVLQAYEDEDITCAADPGITVNTDLRR